MKAGLSVVRPQPQQAPPASRPAAKDERERTPAGAPIERPREIPKTGAAERERDSWRAVIGADAARFHGGIGHKAQDQMNKLLRNKARIAARRGNESLEELFKTMRREDDAAEWRRKHPRRGDDGDDASGSSGDSDTSPPPPPSRPPPEAQKRRAKNWQGIDETLDAIRGPAGRSEATKAPPARGQATKAPPARGQARGPDQRIVIPKEGEDEQS